MMASVVRRFSGRSLPNRKTHLLNEVALIRWFRDHGSDDDAVRVAHRAARELGVSLLAVYREVGGP